jgi:hypothetical protein
LFINASFSIVSRIRTDLRLSWLSSVQTGEAKDTLSARRLRVMSSKLSRGASLVKMLVYRSLQCRRSRCFAATES